MTSTTPRPNKERTVPCPQCGEEALFSPKNHHRPFCSQRCRLIDLGAWSSESYRVSTPSQHTDKTNSD